MKTRLICMTLLLAGCWVCIGAGKGNRAAPMALSASIPDSRNTAGRSAGGYAFIPQSDPMDRAQNLYSLTRRLVPLAEPLKAPRNGGWSETWREPAQSLIQYASDAGANPRGWGGTLVVQPVGNLPDGQRRAIGHILDALASFYGMSVRCAPAIPLSQIPPECFRISGSRRQINAEAFMSTVLRPSMGPDVAAAVALTTEDLYPGHDWPFESTFGWSSFHEGTAILSTSRVLGAGNPDRGKNLRRLCKLAIHELGHTFTIKHCARYNCLMNGCGGLEEMDQKPLWLCPDCLAKLSLATGMAPQRHLEAMREFCRSKSFPADTRYYQKALALLGAG